MASRIRFALPLGLLLASCASAPLVKPVMPDPSNRAEVLVFRVSAFSAGGVALTVGVDAEAYAELGNEQYASVYVAAGNRAFFVQARSAEPAVVSLNLKAGERRCLRTISDSNTNLARNVFPVVLMATGYSFALMEVPCPAADEAIRKYERVDIEYRNTR